MVGRSPPCPLVFLVLLVPLSFRLLYKRVLSGYILFQGVKLVLNPPLPTTPDSRFPWKKGIFVLILLCLIVRGLPYLAPIHAKDIVQEQQAIEFSDRHGLPLGTLLTRDRNHTVAVPLNAVSPQLIRAILAAEDGQFYHHGALWSVGFKGSRTGDRHFYSS